MEPMHFNGWAKDINIAKLLSNHYDVPFSFDFDEETEDIENDVFLRIYATDNECTLEDAERGHLQRLFGNFSARGQDYGYSEYTIEGFNVTDGSVMLGGHDIQKIIDGNMGKYLHIVIDKPESK